MRDAVICEPLRTPVGGFGGSLRDVAAHTLASTVIAALMERTGLAPDAVDDVVLGHCHPTMDAPAIGRVAALDAAGNASGQNDGAAVRVMTSPETAAELGLRPLVRPVSWGLAGGAPKTMGIGPVPATARALSVAGLMLATLTREMIRRDARYGLETMCIGGGQGLAAIFEKV